MTTKPAPQPAAGGRAGMKKELPERFKSYKHVWVFIELERGHVHPVSWELLGEGRKLADKLGVQLAGVVLGGPGMGTREAVEEAFAYGADVAYLVETPLLADYRNEPYTRTLTERVNTYKPEILLLGATTLGRDLAGSVATTLLTGLTADCISGVKFGKGFFIGSIIFEQIGCRGCAWIFRRDIQVFYTC